MPCSANLPPQCTVDVKCICSDAKFIREISCCVAKACSPTEVQKTLQVAQQLCSTVKVQLPNGLPPECAGGLLPTNSEMSTAASSTKTSAGATGGSTSHKWEEHCLETYGMIGTSSTGTSSATGSPTTAAQPAATTDAASCVHVGSNIRILGAALFAAALL